MAMSPITICDNMSRYPLQGGGGGGGLRTSTHAWGQNFGQVAKLEQSQGQGKSAGENWSKGRHRVGVASFPLK